MKKPNVEVKLTKIDWVIEATAGFLVLLIIVFVAINYASLPPIIPTHFNASGVADGFGEKWTILFLASVSVVVYVLTGLAVRFPILMNYPIPITPENHERQYLNAVKLMRTTKLVISATFLFLIYQVIQNAQGFSNGLGKLFFPISFIAVLGTVGYYLYRGYQLK